VSRAGTDVVLFVYGTLAPGEEAWHVLEPYATRTEVSAVAGTLFDTGRGYPAATFGDTGVVHGWRCTLRDAPLAELDAYEGPEYERIQVRCTDGVAAQTYGWIAPLDGCRALTRGRWPDAPKAGGRRIGSLEA
jgi:gamma-glutamylcyclotransferase (GGCT)/AIG2-like uncharacterized protein YtfP